MQIRKGFLHYYIVSTAFIALAMPAQGQEIALAKLGAAPSHRTALESAITTPYFNTKALHQAFATMDSHGLRAEYYQAELARLQSIHSESKQFATHQAMLVREAIADLRYGLGRNNSAKAKQERMAELDELTARLAQCKDIAGCLQQLAARDRQYIPLQMMLAEYREIEAQGGWPQVPAGAKLELGAQGERVQALRQFLTQTGDSSEDDSESILFDEILETAVKRFQSRHGLEADGIVGPKTLQSINTPISKRIEQIELSMDRLRQLPQAQGPHIRVNIPSYRLQAFDGEALALEMEVIVGQVSRKTPLFDNAITSLVLNPTWTPTPRIIREDILPKVRNNPAYLSGGYVVTNNYTGEQIDPTMIDWSMVEAGDVRIMQRSGAGNALGKIKFDMPSSDAIYLHDTSKPYLFKESYRALSSGCIRVSQPDKLLRYVASVQGEDFAQKATKQYQSTAHTSLKLAKPVPVKATYFTAWVNKHGQIEFYGDVYQRDASARLAWNKMSNRQYVSR